MHFKYKAKETTGQVATGTITATSQVEAHRQLREQGLFPLSLQPQKKTGTSQAKSGFRIGSGVKKADLLMLTSQLSIMCQSEIDLAEALQHVASQCTKPVLKKILDEGHAGDNGNIFISHFSPDDIQIGSALATPGTIVPVTDFKAEVYVLTKEEGGRHTPFHNNYRPQFYFRTTDVTGEINLLDGREMVMPGDNLIIEIELITPIALYEGLKFAVRDQDGKDAGTGVVTEILK